MEPKLPVSIPWTAEEFGKLSIESLSRDPRFAEFLQNWEQSIPKERLEQYCKMIPVMALDSLEVENLAGTPEAFLALWEKAGNLVPSETTIRTILTNATTLSSEPGTFGNHVATYEFMHHILQFTDITVIEEKIKPENVQQLQDVLGAVNLITAVLAIKEELGLRD